MISYVAIIILNTIALIAILVANRELTKAFREMDRLSSERASERAVAARSAFPSSCANHSSANSLSIGLQVRSESLNLTSSGPSDSSFARKLSPIVCDIPAIPNVELTGSPASGESELNVGLAMTFGWCKDPAGNPLDLSAFDISKCSKPVVSVEDFKTPIANCCNERNGDCSIGLNEVCTCPKPLLSVFDVCSHCLSASSAVRNYFVSHQDAHWCNWGGRNINTHPLPATREPD